MQRIGREEKKKPAWNRREGQLATGTYTRNGALAALHPKCMQDHCEFAYIKAYQTVVPNLAFQGMIDM